MRESALEAKLVKAAKAAGGLCIKLAATNTRGIPDRLLVLPGGRVYFVELKTSRGRASVLQLRYQEILRKMGFKSDIIHGQTQLKAFIDAHLQLFPGDLP